MYDEEFYFEQPVFLFLYWIKTIKETKYVSKVVLSMENLLFVIFYLSKYNKKQQQQ